MVKICGIIQLMRLYHVTNKHDQECRFLKSLVKVVAMGGCGGERLSRTFVRSALQTVS
jgi:hypothetical protein